MKLSFKYARVHKPKQAAETALEQTKRHLTRMQSVQMEKHIYTHTHTQESQISTVV